MGSSSRTSTSSDCLQDFGSIVALEGQPETVSTQLRLLPLSSQVLVLPDLHHYLSADQTSNDDFRAHEYIKSVHKAAADRHDAATKFLQASAPDRKRLVFTDGGVASAQALCVRAIMQHETDGDLPRAQAVFSHLIKEGLHGIESQWKRRRINSGFDSENEQEVGTYRANDALDLSEDPITRAMRAADALDRETALLQESDDFDPLTKKPRPRSLSVPLYGYMDSADDTAPFLVFGASQAHDASGDVQSGDQTNAGSMEDIQEDDEENLDAEQVQKSETTTKGGAQPTSEDVDDDAEDEMEDETEDETEQGFLPAKNRFSVTHYDEPEEATKYLGFLNRRASAPPQSPGYQDNAFGMFQDALGMETETEAETEASSPNSVDAGGLHTSQGVVFGEASVLQLPQTTRKTAVAVVPKPRQPVRSKSLDKSFTSRIDDDDEDDDHDDDEGPVTPTSKAEQTPPTKADALRKGDAVHASPKVVKIMAATKTTPPPTEATSDLRKLERPRSLLFAKQRSSDGSQDPSQIVRPQSVMAISHRGSDMFPDAAAIARPRSGLSSYTAKESSWDAMRSSRPRSSLARSLDDNELSKAHRPKSVLVLSHKESERLSNGTTAPTVASRRPASLIPTLKVARDASESKSARRQTWMAQTLEDAEDSVPNRRTSLMETNRTVLVRPKKMPVVTVAPVPLDRKRKSLRPVYVDHGTDAEEVPLPPEEAEPPPFEPVLPMTEHLVIHLREEVDNLVLSTIIQDFKSGLVSTAASPQPETESDRRTVPSSASATPELTSKGSSSENDDNDGEEEGSDSDSGSDTGTITATVVEVDEYDPFSYTQPARPVRTAASSKTMSKTTTTTMTQTQVVEIEAPPTPETTPTPSINTGEDERFQDLDVPHGQPAVWVQNALRRFLSAQFPLREVARRHPFGALLPTADAEGLWRPVFGPPAEASSPRPSHQRMDQILAVGSQRTVDPDFATAVFAQLEKLGTKLSGLGRNGRLDLRYLLTTALQSAAAQSLSQQAVDDLGKNPALLASLVLPQMETFLAFHQEVRYLLLEFPPELLPTIMAMQKLAGVDLFKVAQIIDPNSKDTMPFKYLHANALKTQDIAGMRAPSMYGKPAKAQADLAASRSNFLLSSAASDAEIATFMTTIWKILTDISPFYLPEPSNEIDDDTATITSINTTTTDHNHNNNNKTKKNTASASAATTPRQAPARKSMPDLQSYSSEKDPKSPTSTLQSSVGTVKRKPLPISKPDSLVSPRPAAVELDSSAAPTTKKKPAPILTSKFAGLTRSTSMYLPPATPASGMSTPRARSPAPSVAETFKTRRSGRSRHSTTRSFMRRGWRPPTADGVSVITYDPAEDSDYDMEEKRLMPMFGRRPRPRKGNSRKALKFLGLA